MKNLQSIFLAVAMMLFWGTSSFAQFEKPLFSSLEDITLNNLSFVNDDLREVFRKVSDLSKKNIVVDPEVAGKITLFASSTSLNDLFRILAIKGNLQFSNFGNYVMVFSNIHAPIVTVMRSVRNKKAQAVAKALKKLSSFGFGEIEVDDRTNSLMITDDPRVIKTIDLILPSLDEQEPIALSESTSSNNPIISFRDQVTISTNSFEANQYQIQFSQTASNSSSILVQIFRKWGEQPENIIKIGETIVDARNEKEEPFSDYKVNLGIFLFEGANPKNIIIDFRKPLQDQK